MKTKAASLALAVVAGWAASLAAPPPAAAGSETCLQRPGAASSATVPHSNQRGDSLPGPLADKQAQLRQEALADVLGGRARPQRIANSMVVERGAQADGRGRQYVELANERTDRVFVLLVEFGDQRHPDFPDADVDADDPGPFRFDGPRFNQMPRPGRDDNVTNWRARYDRRYFRKLVFGERSNKLSMRQYYEIQSSGRYSISGDVTEIVRVPYNQARYGRSFDGVLFGVPCTLQARFCGNVWPLIDDAMKQWVADQKAAGRSDAEIATHLGSYDQYDRYDHDGDGNFNEPDGYLDHMMVVHAGHGRNFPPYTYGEDAITSHRSYAYYPDVGITGPAFNPLGGSQIDGTGYWVGDYTIQAENDDLPVFAHEYGHDLGLPDHYDTRLVTRSYDFDQTQGFWSLMSNGSLSAPGDRGIVTRPGDLGVWDKLMLGWLDYELAFAGEDRTIELGPHEHNSAKPQALVVVLPDHPAPIPLPVPAEGSRQWWSGEGNAYVASMSRQDVAVPASGATLTMQIAYNIEEDFDYASVQVESPAGSGNWLELPTSSIDPDAGTVAEAGIDGFSGGYLTASFDLAPYAGQTIGLGILYVTDGSVLGASSFAGWSGVLVDDIVVTSGGTTVFADGAESSPNGWTLGGFASVGDTGTALRSHYYLASYRSYRSYDRYLRTGPHLFGYPSRPLRVDHYPYQDGLLVNYWNTAFRNNNTSEHPGGGLILVVDADPEVLVHPVGVPFPGREQKYDATFGLQRTDEFVLHGFDIPYRIESHDPRPLFDDTDPLRYFTPFANAGIPGAGVIVAGAGVQLEVLKQTPTGMTVHLR